MCGVHGFTWKDTDRAVDRMVEAARHRGPDGSGTWGDDRVTLGHNLLSVADDPDNSRQPWAHAGTVLAFNGQVFNHLDLRPLLTHQCVTGSDTETLAAGLVEHGPDFLRRVDGMFALAWYDSKDGTLLLARDTNGSRPMYYADTPGGLAFSSEIRSLLALGLPRRVSKEAFRHYYHAGLVAGPLTLFDGIRRLVPGEVIRVDLTTGLRTTSNLNRAVTPYTGKPFDLLDLLRSKLRQAVSLVGRPRRRVGLYLSGGLDSTSVLHELAAIGRRPRSYSTRFELPHPKCRHNEDAALAEMVAKTYEVKHRELTVTQADWVAAVEATTLALEEPRQGKSLPAYYLTAALLAASGVVVTLSGDGGDELLLGYKHQTLTPFSRRLEGLRLGLRPLPDRDLHITVGEQADYLDGWLPKAGLTGDETNDFLYTECLHTLAEDFLVRNDKLGAAFGMEARFPMMSNVFRDFCRSIPSNLKAVTWRQGGWSENTKPLLRMAYAGRLPTTIVHKPKSGWRAPTDDWLIGSIHHPAGDGPMRQYVRETLADPIVRELFGVTAADVENRYLNNRDFAGPMRPSGKPATGPGLSSQKELFTLLAFTAWFRAFDMHLW